MIAIFRPNFSEIHPKTNTKAMPPKEASDDIHDSSSLVMGSCFNGEFSDLNNCKFGPVKPITIPKMKAVT